MQKIRIYMFILGAIGIVGLSGFFFYKYFVLPQKAMQYNVENKTAYQTFISNDFENSIEQTKMLLVKAPNKSEEGRLKIILAASHWFRNKNDDRTQAIKRLKEVVDDYTIPAAWRAQALNSLARFVQDSSLSFYQIHFTETPYSAFVPAEGTETQKLNAVYLALLKYSDDTYPTSWAEYAIASHYAYISTTNSSSLSSEDLVTLMQKYVAEGDTRQDVSIYSPSVLILGYHYRALGLARAATILNLDQNSSVEVEQAFANVYATAKRLNQEELSAHTLWRTRFFNANFLSRFPERESDTVDLLRPYSSADINDTALIGWAKTIKAAPKGSFLNVTALKLGEISPDFKAFLTKLQII